MSLSTNSSKNNRPLVKVKGGKNDGDVIYLNTTPPLTGRQAKCVDLSDGKFEPIPNTNSERSIIYVCGPSGSGKSTYSANYISAYRILYPKNKIFVFSLINEDPVIDALKPNRIPLNEELYEDPIDWEDFGEHCLILFDDTDSISDEKIVKALRDLQIKLMSLGRHKSITLVITSHLINSSDRNLTRTILNELSEFVVFPSSGTSYQISYVLKKYFGFSTKQIDNLIHLPSRWVCVLKNYPLTVISEKSVYIL